MARRVDVVLLVAESFEQGSGDVAFTEVADDGDDGFSCVFWFFRFLESSPDVASGGDASEDAFFGGCCLRCGDCVVEAHGHDFVEDVPIEGFGVEVGSDTLDFVGSCASFRKERGVGGFYADDGDVVVVFFEVGSCAADRSSGADASNENIDVAICVVPDFRAGGVVVLRGVGGVGEL